MYNRNIDSIRLVIIFFRNYFQICNYTLRLGDKIGMLNRNMQYYFDS